MEYKHLKNIAQITMGQSPKSETYNNKKEGLPFFQGNADFGEISPKVRIWCSVPKTVAHKNDILISVRAPIGALNIADTECCIGRGLAAISVRNIKDRDYIFNALKAKSEYLKNRGTGSTFKAINKNILEDVEIPIVSTEKRDIEIKVLNKLNIVKKQKEKELSKLDTLIKARFVEMYGDPIINNKHLTEVSMTQICQIIDGDRGKNYPHAKDFESEGYCLFLNAKNVTKNGFNFENCSYISKERDELLRKGRVERGDIVLTTRGTIGNLALYTNDIPYERLRINSGMVILRMDHTKVLDRFFIEQFKMQLEKIKLKVASGSAQPQLPVSTMNKIKIVLPSTKAQNEFASFVQQVDKSKVVNNLIMKYIISIDFICSLI